MHIGIDTAWMGRIEAEEWQVKGWGEGGLQAALQHVNNQQREEKKLHNSAGLATG